MKVRPIGGGQGAVPQDRGWGPAEEEEITLGTVGNETGLWDALFSTPTLGRKEQALSCLPADLPLSGLTFILVQEGTAWSRAQ